MQNKNKNEQRMFLKICSAAGKYKCGAKVPCKRKLFTLRRIHNNCSRRAWTNENQPPFQCHSYRCTLLRFCKQRHVALLLFFCDIVNRLRCLVCECECYFVLFSLPSFFAMGGSVRVSECVCVQSVWFELNALCDGVAGCCPHTTVRICTKLSVYFRCWVWLLCLMYNVQHVP